EDQLCDENMAFGRTIGTNSPAFAQKEFTRLENLQISSQIHPENTAGAGCHYAHWPNHFSTRDEPSQISGQSQFQVPFGPDSVPATENLSPEIWASDKNDFYTQSHQNNGIGLGEDQPQGETMAKINDFINPNNFFGMLLDSD